jgi:hypothetical protein
MTGTVLAVSRSATHSLSKSGQLAIQLLAGLGVADDAHAGVTVQHRSRVVREPAAVLAEFGLRLPTGVEIRVWARGERAGFDFSDNGPSIPRDRAEDVFLPHYTTRPGAAGMGVRLASGRIARCCTTCRRGFHC